MLQTSAKTMCMRPPLLHRADREFSAAHLACILAVLLAGPSGAAIFLVSTPASTGAGSLREAITSANEAAGLDTIGFAMPGALPAIIGLTSTLPAITSPLYLDGYTQPGSTPATGASQAIIGVQLLGAGGGTGLSIQAESCTVRGLSIGAFATGVLIQSPPGTIIEGNHIGVDAAGEAAVPNGRGIRLLSAGHRIGGASPGARNLISGNTDHGIDIHTGDWGPEPGQANSIIGNHIGADASGGNALGNGGCGIAISRGADTAIGGAVPGSGNVIAFNGGPGIFVAHGIRNGILSNTIFDNGGLGIDLLWDYWDSEPDGVNPNDAGDGDWGANELQNYPVLTGAVSDGSAVTITGTLNSKPGAPYRLEFYSAPSPDGSGHGEGNTFMGASEVITNASGLCDFTATMAFLPVSGSFLTATATDALNNTSEFSLCVAFQGSTVATSWLDSGPGSLRNAMVTANLTPGVDTISFAIPGQGPHLIRVQSALPALSDPVIIDGYSQGGAMEATASEPAELMIEIDGTLLSGNDCGLTLAASGCTVRGLAVDGFPWCGILAEYSDSHVIAGNHLGVAGPGGAARGNGIGLYLKDTENTLVGGALPSARNVISGNDLAGLVMAGSGDVAQGNFVGTSPDGMFTLGNGIGVVLGESETLGGDEPSCRNIVTGNGSHGVVAVLSGSAVMHNWIGMTADGTVAGNGGVGVAVGMEWLDASVWGGRGFTGAPGYAEKNTIMANVVCGSALLGIDLWPPGPGDNDSGDGDTGANGQQNHPVILSAGQDQGVTTLSGQLQSTPHTAFCVDFYCDDLADPTNRGEGLIPLGSTTTITDAQGNGDVSFQVPSALIQGRFVCATATTPDGSTSEFGPCLIIGGSGVVTTEMDNGAGSLRMAIASANASADISTVTFALPGPGPHIIRPASPLPPISRPVILDGYTQAGAQPASESNPAVIMVHIDGTLAGEGADGLTLAGDGVIVTGVLVAGFSGSGLRVTGAGAGVRGSWIGAPTPSFVGNGGSGILIEGAGMTVGGTVPAERCVVSGNLGDGIRISGALAAGNTILGTYIGTDALGANARPNGSAGIRMGGEDNILGNGRLDGRNIISGNTGEGVVIESDGNVVRGNHIGVDVTGCHAVGNASHGVLITAADDATVGDEDPGSGNIISANGGAGVSIRYMGANGNRLRRNHIGTDASGNPMGNAAAGVSIRGALGTIVGGDSPSLGNVIAFNGGPGIEVVTGSGSNLICNSIHDNGSLGIDLGPSGVTLNDLSDVDTGANALQNFPELCGARCDPAGTLSVWGWLNSTPSGVFTVDFYWSPSADPSGYGEGFQWAGRCTVNTGSNGEGAFDGSFPIGAPAAGAVLSALATSASGNTSEFCLSPPIEGLPAPEPSGALVFALCQNAPNPFLCSTAITFMLPRDSFATLDIFDASGRAVRRLVAGPVDAGAHTVRWDGAAGGGARAAAGVYLCRLQAGERHATMPVVLLR